MSKWPFPNNRVSVTELVFGKDPDLTTTALSPFTGEYEDLVLSFKDDEIFEENQPAMQSDKIEISKETLKAYAADELVRLIEAVKGSIEVRTLTGEKLSVSFASQDELGNIAIYTGLPVDEHGDKTQV